MTSIVLVRPDRKSIISYLEDPFKRPWGDAGRLELAVSDHGVCLAAAGLSVREDADVEAIDGGLNKIVRVFENRFLPHVRHEHAVEKEQGRNEFIPRVSGFCPIMGMNMLHGGRYSSLMSG